MTGEREAGRGKGAWQGHRQREGRVGEIILRSGILYRLYSHIAINFNQDISYGHFVMSCTKTVLVFNCTTVSRTSD